MKVAKKLYFDIPGLGRVKALPGASFNPGGPRRDAVTADTGVVGFTEEPVAPSLTFKLPVTADVDLDVLRNLTDVNVTVQDDNGTTWIVSDAWTSEPPTQSGGEIDMKMEGVRADKV